jgi:hypothetical protein
MGSSFAQTRNFIKRFLLYVRQGVLQTYTTFTHVNSRFLDRSVGCFRVEGPFNISRHYPECIKTTHM